MTHCGLNHIIFKLSYLLVFFFTVYSINAWADKTQGRAAYVETVNEEQILLQSLRSKIITTRTLSLYLEDLLPSMGSPYKHLAQFVTNNTLEAYNKAQKYDGPEMDQIKWSPLVQGKIYIIGSSLSLPVVQYLSDWVASVKVQNVAKLIIQSSIVVESLENALSSENLLKYNRVLQLLSFVAGHIEKELQSNPNLVDLLLQSQRKAYVKLTYFTTTQMIPYLHYIETPQNKAAIQAFIKRIEVNANRKSFDTEAVKQIKSNVKTLMKSPEYKIVSASLDSVDLPDSGDILGSDESFEAVMRLELGFDLIKAIFLNVENW